MNQKIEAVFLYLGNTLRILTKNDTHQSQARRKIVELLGAKEDADLFCQKLDQRYKVYRKWAFENMKEAPESELWTRWLAPEFPAERTGPLGVELTYQFRPEDLPEAVITDENKPDVIIHHFTDPAILIPAKPSHSSGRYSPAISTNPHWPVVPISTH